MAKKRSLEKFEVKLGCEMCLAETSSPSAGPTWLIMTYDDNIEWRVDIRFTTTTTMTTMTMGWGGPRVEVKVIRRNPTRCWTPTFCLELRFCIIQNSANSFKFITPATIYTIYFHHPNLYIVTLYHIISSDTYHEDATWHPLKAWFDGNDWWTHAEADAQWKRHRNLRELSNAASTGGQHLAVRIILAFGCIRDRNVTFFFHFTLLFSVAALYSSLYFPTPHKFIKKTCITKRSQKTMNIEHVQRILR